jgi:hypothetical protein
MKTYPAPNCAPESYRAELAKHLHDPWAKGMVDVLWHGTVEYQKFIENDGIEHHRALLAHIRGWRALNRKNVQDGEKAAKTLLADATKKEKQAGQLATMCKPHLQKKIDQLRRDANANRQLAAKNAEAITTLYRKQGFTLEDADARLTAAMIYYMDNPPQRSEAPLPPAPIININVEPTPITVEAIMPAQTEIAITAMPIRKTTTTILRDQAGDIATSVQVESDA